MGRLSTGEIVGGGSARIQGTTTQISSGFETRLIAEALFLRLGVGISLLIKEASSTIAFMLRAKTSRRSSNRPSKEIWMMTTPTAQNGQNSEMARFGKERCFRTIQPLEKPRNSRIRYEMSSTRRHALANFQIDCNHK
jgi:hypothetical protein